MEKQSLEVNSLSGKKTEMNHVRRLQKDDFQLILIVGFVSIACISVFPLPSEMKNMLKVGHSVFNPIAYVTASFVHDDPLPLGLNLSAFLLATYVLYFINKRISEQKFFFFSLLIMFVALPVLNYGFLFYFGIYRFMEFESGLSLVDSGLIGFIIPSLMLYFKHKLKRFNSILFFTSMVLFTFSLVSLPYAEEFDFPLPALCAILGIGFEV